MYSSENGNEKSKQNLIIREIILTSWTSLQSLEPPEVPKLYSFSPKKRFMYLLFMCFYFLAVVSLPSCSEKGLLIIATCAGFSLQWLPLLQSTGSTLLRLQQFQCKGSEFVAHGLICCMACGIFPDQGSNTCVPCLARRTLNYWNTREAHELYFQNHSSAVTIQ